VKKKAKWGVIVGLTGLVVLSLAQSDGFAAAAQARKRVTMTRLYTGADNKSRLEEIEVAFPGGPGVNVAQLLKTTGAELRRTPAGTVQDWHVASRRQYIITLSGQSEVQDSTGKKSLNGPGHISLIEDTSGQGHLTRVVGVEDVVALVLPLADQPVK
jgi:hypothetical protein